MDTRLQLLWTRPTLRPVAPLVLAAWQDGFVTPADMLRIRETLDRGPWLDPEARDALASWLDGDSPPPPQALSQLQREVHTWLSGLPSSQRRSYGAVSAALADESLQACDLEAALPVLTAASEDLALPYFDHRAWLDATAERTDAEWPRSADEQHVAALRERLEAGSVETRDFVRGVLAAPDFRGKQGLATHDYREQVLSWLQQLYAQGLVTHCYPDGFESGRDLTRFVATFETLAMFDLSLTVKVGVQAGLFSGTVEGLGSARHRSVLERSLRGELVGCFAMTERGHGSNVRGLRTVARFDPDTDQFVLNTPDLAAGKEWIGNAANHARMAVVFAQLETLGESYGVHAFLVPIRDAAGEPLDGVRIEDCGTKMGLNGVDNGRLWFDHVAVARDALLDRFGQVDAEGQYESPIPSAGKRFFSMLSTLVGGRIAVAGGANAAAKVGLAIALRYAVERTQFEGADGTEQPLIAYLSHRRRLLPALAATYAFTFAQAELVRAAAATEDPEGAASLDVDTLAAGIKALGTWQAIDTLQQCRECCGGQGYLTSNRIDALRTDTDVFTTFEGDNTVLLSLVANNLLRHYQKAMEKRPVRTLIKRWYDDLTAKVAEHDPRSASPDTLRSLDFQAGTLRFREQALLSSLTRRISSRMRDGLSAQEAFEQCQDHALSVARAYIERFVFNAFRRATREEPRLEPLCSLYGLWRIEHDLSWFLENGRIDPSASRHVRATLNTAVGELAGNVLDWVDAFGVPASCLGPLADPEYLAASGLTSKR